MLSLVGPNFPALYLIDTIITAVSAFFLINYISLC